MGKPINSIFTERYTTSPVKQTGRQTREHVQTSLKNRYKDLKQSDLNVRSAGKVDIS